MFEYKFVEVPIKKTFTSKKATAKTIDNIKNIIDENAKESWRFVQIFSPIGDGLLVADHYEIIFERKIN
jgi:hypothetical protein